MVSVVATLSITVIGASIGYGSLSNKVRNLENEKIGMHQKLDVLIKDVAEIKGYLKAKSNVSNIEFVDN